MPALVVLYPRDAPSSSVLLKEGDCPVAGRDAESDIPLGDPRVSLRHARFLWKSNGFWLRDLGSRNGTFVNGLRVWESELRSEDWISFGGFPAQYILASETELSAFLAGRAARRRSSGEIRTALQEVPSSQALLSRLVEAAVSVAGAERGFAIVNTGKGLILAEVGRRERAGDSRAAIERVLSTGRPVVTADAQVEVFMVSGSGVVPRGLPRLAGAVACIPMCEGDDIVGVLALEGKLAGVSFTDLEVQILETLTERAILLLGTHRFDLNLRPLEAAALRAEVLVA